MGNVTTKVNAVNDIVTQTRNKGSAIEQDVIATYVSIT